jgi:metal-responsive CopG/Arc/MetJ family transcriptional regulator
VRVKTSITLPADLLQSIDKINPNRSDFIEKASRAYLTHIERTRRDARDIEIYNRTAKRLNAEARDAMRYQSSSHSSPQSSALRSTRNTTA